MIMCKYSKIGSAVFVPHLDILRAVIMAFRRTGIAVAYSEGYNPHMQLYFNQPLPIGTASECEYFCAHSDCDPNALMQKLNGSLPEGVRILRAGRVSADPNVAKIMYSALYTVTMREKVQDLSRVKDVLQRQTYEITYSSKGKLQCKDVRALIEDVLSEGDNVLRLRLRCGNQNLRADRLTEHLLAELGAGCGFDVVKNAMFAGDGKDIDDICFGKATEG